MIEPWRKMVGEQSDNSQASSECSWHSAFSQQDSICGEVISEENAFSNIALEDLQTPKTMVDCSTDNLSSTLINIQSHVGKPPLGYLAPISIPSPTTPSPSQEPNTPRSILLRPDTPRKHNRSVSFQPNAVDQHQSPNRDLGDKQSDLTLRPRTLMRASSQPSETIVAGRLDNHVPTNMLRESYFSDDSSESPLYSDFTRVWPPPTALDNNYASTNMQRVAQIEANMRVEFKLLQPKNNPPAEVDMRADRFLRYMSFESIAAAAIGRAVKLPVAPPPLVYVHDEGGLDGFYAALVENFRTCFKCRLLEVGSYPQKEESPPTTIVFQGAISGVGDSPYDALPDGKAKILDLDQPSIRITESPEKASKVPIFVNNDEEFEREFEAHVTKIFRIFNTSFESRGLGQVHDLAVDKTEPHADSAAYALTISLRTPAEPETLPGIDWTKGDILHPKYHCWTRRFRTEIMAEMYKYRRLENFYLALDRGLTPTARIIPVCAGEKAWQLERAIGGYEEFFLRHYRKAWFQHSIGVLFLPNGQVDPN